MVEESPDALATSWARTAVLSVAGFASGRGARSATADGWLDVGFRCRDFELVRGDGEVRTGDGAVWAGAGVTSPGIRELGSGFAVAGTEDGSLAPEPGGEPADPK